MPNLMDNFILFDKSNLKGYLNKRTAESKLGEQIKKLTTISSIYDQLKDLDVSYVIFGINENAGVFAHNGNSGTYDIWEETLKVLLNTQSNPFTPAKKVLILGHFDFKNYEKKLEKLEPKKKKDQIKARKYVSKIDVEVSYLVYQIVKAGKIPIVIGGGQNNAYGCLKGSALGFQKPINAINFDIQADFNKEDGRHSSNSFSYAFSEGFLNKYFIFGMHESYILESNLATLNKLNEIEFNTFDAFNRKELKFKQELKRASEFICDDSFGIEIDCKSIQHASGSQSNPSGFNLNKVRKFITYFGQKTNASYLHISEGFINEDKPSNPIGKVISYLITDFIKAHEIK